MSHPVTNPRRLQSLARRPLGGLVLAAACFATFFPHAAAYGPAGHQTVGTVADWLIVGTPAGARVQALLGGDSLESAAAATCDLRPLGHANHPPQSRPRRLPPRRGASST